ncbi:MAG TPA: hypothetical protein VMH35_21765 [Streptosporangiaceae bacterium]|nr:hypothetical protein [Streptosporangiaceae bacterium]
MTSLAGNRLPYLAPLRWVVGPILGPAAFSYPVKVLRAVPRELPAQRPRSRYVPPRQESLALASCWHREFEGVMT